MTVDPTELVPGLWRWTTRHPEWHPGEFGAEVACFALVDVERLLLVDPLLPEEERSILDGAPGGGDEGARVLRTLDQLASGREVVVLITLGYHVRSSELFHGRYGGEVWGPAEAAKRLSDPDLLRVYSADDPAPGGVQAHAVGRPPRGERILWLPSHRAVAFGDVVVTTPAGELRLWDQDDGEDRAQWYRERFVPTFDPILEHPVEHVLVTHGAPVISGGSAALRGALAAPPWQRRGA